MILKGNTAKNKSEITLNDCLQTINIVEGNMDVMLKKWRNKQSLAFAHSISADFEDPKHMSAGVAVVFKNNIGSPKNDDLICSNLTCQQVQNGALVYSIVTKAKYYEKPTQENYDKAFDQLINDFQNRGLKTLICSPMGCVRDFIQPEHFINKIISFQSVTGATVYIVLDEKETKRMSKISGGLHKKLTELLTNHSRHSKSLQEKSPALHTIEPLRNTSVTSTPKSFTRHATDTIAPTPSPTNASLETTETNIHTPPAQQQLQFNVTDEKAPDSVQCVSSEVLRQSNFAKDVSDIRNLDKLTD